MDVQIRHASEPASPLRYAPPGALVLMGGISSGDNVRNFPEIFEFFFPEKNPVIRNLPVFFSPTFFFCNPIPRDPKQQIFSRTNNTHNNRKKPGTIFGHGSAMKSYLVLEPCTPCVIMPDISKSWNPVFRTTRTVPTFISGVFP